MNPNFQNALRRASAHPIKTGFLFTAGVHLADLAFAVLRLLVLVAVLGAIAWGTWALMKRDTTTNTKPSSASQQTRKADNTKPERMQGSPQGRAGSIPASRSERPQNTQNLE